MGHQDKKYELSLWQDDPNFCERRVCILASEIMDSPAKAFNISLNRKTNGEKTLTFSILAKYYDQELLEFITNPYLSLLSNERKVKLCKNEYGEKKWYDFVIKGIAEDSSSQVYTYTAKDQHIQELAKSGFELEFDKELQNNTGTKECLAEEILKGTGWGVGKGDDLWEYSKEPVYSCEVTRGLTIYDKDNPKVEVTTLGPSGSKNPIIFIPYSELNNKEEYCQVIVPKARYATAPKLNDEGILNRDDYENFYVKRQGSLGLEGDEEKEIQPLEKKLVPGIQGEKLNKTQKTIYDKAVGQYVKVYSKKEKEYYGFTKTEYFTPELVENLITNGEGDFTNDSGWYNTGGATRELVFSPEISDWTEEEEIYSYIAVTPEKECYIVNTGLFDRRMQSTGFIEGQEYFFKCTLKEDETAKVTKVKICEYDFNEEGRYIPKEGGIILFSDNSGANILSCKETITAEEFKKTKFGIFIYFDSEAKIKKCSFYRAVKDKNGEIIVPGSISTLETEDLVKTHHYYYLPNESYTKFEDIAFEYEGYEEQREYTPVYDGFEKKRTITGKESNRYNLLQEICEQFECWLDIEVDHYDNGGIIPNKIENGQVVEYHKRVSFREYIGKKNHAGFKYGVNLKSIKRNIDSNQIVTKMITKDNSNEFAKNGFCSIARAPSNPSGTNVIYNFDYYIGQNLLDAEEVSKALYATSQDQVKDEGEKLEFPIDWGLYSKLNYITSITQAITEEQIGISKNLTSLRSSIEVEQARLDGAESSLVEEQEGLKKLTGYSYDDILEHKVGEDYDKWNWKDSTDVNSYKIKIRHLRTEKKIAEGRLGSETTQGLKFELQKFQSQYNANKLKLEFYNEQRKKIEQEFYQKYARFIQEGSWISEDYIDDELYYLDALATGYTSSRPKVSYTIDVFDLAPIENYENYEFQIGDKTFMENYENHIFQIGDKTHVEDPDFFGYDRQTVTNPITGEEVVIRVPHREEVVVNEMTEGIDDITKNAIKVQNYKTQFDDLFQRIAATTESLQYNTGRYERGAKVVEPNGSISHKALQQAVTENGLAIANAGAQTVTIDEQGVVTTDKTLPNKKVRIVGGGIYVTKDGGETWETGITGDGINANVITTGQLNTGEINIMTGDAASHRWDSKGITAYRTNYNPETGEILSISPNSFVRLDEFGLYGINSDQEFNARLGTTTTGDEKHGIAKIQRDSLFSLTQDGLTIGKEGYGLKATEENITIGPEGFITIGKKEGKTTYSIFIGEGFEATQDSLRIAGWSVDSTKLSHKNNSYEFFISPSGATTAPDISGDSETDIGYTIYAKNATDDEEYKFGVTVKGELHAQGAKISGYIEANSGYIGNIKIENGGIASGASKIATSPSFEGGLRSYDGTIEVDGQSAKQVYLYANKAPSSSQVSIQTSGVFHWYIINKILDSIGDQDRYTFVDDGDFTDLILPSGSTLLVEVDQGATCELLTPSFSIDGNGYLYAQNANISGTINAGNGTIGNIKIEDGGLTVNKTDSTELILKQTIKHSTTKISNTAVKIQNWGTGTRSVKYYQINETGTVNFSVKTKSDDGWTLIAIMDTLPTGNTASHPCTKVITAKSGTHPFEIKKNQYVLLSYTSIEPTWDFNDTGFSISSDGIIQAKSLIVKKLQLDGAIVASDSATIAGWTINNSGLYSGDFSLTPNGEQGYLFQCGNNFNIKADGNVGIGPNDTWTITDTRIKTQGELEDINMVFPSGPQSVGLPVGGTYLGYLQCPGLLDEKYPQAFLGIRRTTKNNSNEDVYDYPLFISYTGLIKASTVVFHNEYANEPSRVLVFNADNTVTWKEWSVPW